MRIVAFLAAALAIFPISLLSAAEITPIKAAFASTLKDYHGPGELQAWEGSLRYSISRDCQKWTSKTEIVYRFTVNGVDSEIRAASTVYEALDGNRIEFNTRTKSNGQTPHHKKGSAKLQSRGKPGVATYRVLQGETLNLPAGTIFTVTSWLASINQLGAGKKRWKQLVFSDGELTIFFLFCSQMRRHRVGQPKGEPSLISQAG